MENCMEDKYLLYDKMLGPVESDEQPDAASLKEMGRVKVPTKHPGELWVTLEYQLFTDGEHAWAKCLNVLQLDTDPGEPSPVCRVIYPKTGAEASFIGHEPDEELEKAVWPGDVKFLEFFKRDSERDENGVFKDENKVGTVRFCKHCGCLYVEKP
jgi:hypothetical protein